MAKSDKFYFENFVERSVLAQKAANYLVECLENYNADNIQQMISEMHAIEHSADMKKHEMNKALAKAFVTPIDREDLDSLSHHVDDINDQIEEVLQKFYIYDIKEVKPYAVDFAKSIVTACDLLHEIMMEFENFKKSKRLHLGIVELNDVEEECDKLYLTAMRELTKTSTDALETISWRGIYDDLEGCIDACEYVSEYIGSVIMKNT